MFISTGSVFLFYAKIRHSDPTIFKLLQKRRFHQNTIYPIHSQTVPPYRICHRTLVLWVYGWSYCNSPITWLLLSPKRWKPNRNIDPSGNKNRFAIERVSAVEEWTIRSVFSFAFTVNVFEILPHNNTYRHCILRQDCKPFDVLHKQSVSLQSQNSFIQAWTDLHI